MVLTPPERDGREAPTRSHGLIRRRIVCRGTVQGVGFRPAVVRLARRLGLAGLVRNDGEGATIEVEGGAASVTAFQMELVLELPPLARIEEREETPLAATGEQGFRVDASVSSTRRRALVPPDARVCAACRRELDDPRDRRHAHPFTTCTHCGPRFTLVESLPYDRERTSMARFPLCPECNSEYTDVNDRRFHAEPVCCPRCGPKLALFGADRALLAEGERVLPLARAALIAGEIVAVKGLGGFQLACRADDVAAVRRLRTAKQRATKPFAVMARDIVAARRLVRLRPEDEALLDSARGPILLAARRHDAAACAELAPGLDDLGVMLPTTPLHVELFRGAPYAALVMTSGNASDEPICRTDEEALKALSTIADVILVHEREIVRRCDDSVVRTLDEGHVLVRRSRGFVPEPVTLGFETPQPVLAFGAHLQNTVALAAGTAVFPSQHVGDLDTESARAFQLEVALGLEDFLQARADVIATDMHPDYPSTWLGRHLAVERGGTHIAVQHHVAHAAAVLGEHGRFPRAKARVGALVCDGTGFGPDGTAWGGEWLVLDGDLGWKRVARVEPVPLVGGERAVREPWRVAAAVLARAGLADEVRRLSLAARVPRAELDLLIDFSRRGSFPLASGAGRLFEAAGALLGLCARNGYEGEAAARLEALAARATSPSAWPEVRLPPDRPELPSSDLLTALARRSLAREGECDLAAGFHATFSALAAALAARVFEGDVRTIALGGGCFVNRLLQRELVSGLERAGFDVLVPRALPPGDGGLAYGQCVIAAAALARERVPTQIGDIPCASPSPCS